MNVPILVLTEFQKNPVSFFNYQSLFSAFSISNMLKAFFSLNLIFYYNQT